MPRPGSACSAYLIETRETAVLLDVGHGAAGKLQTAIDPARLSAIVVSHMHADHFFDLVPLRYGLKYAGGSPQRISLWLPPGGRDTLGALAAVVRHGAHGSDFFGDAFTIREFDPERLLNVGDLRLTFRRTQHYIEAFAIRAERDGDAITYSADTAPCGAVVDHARDSTLFLCEAALGLGSESGERGHSSAREAGEMAAGAAVGRLVLTHYPGGDAVRDLVAAARQSYAGPIDTATDGLEIATADPPQI